MIEIEKFLRRAGMSQQELADSLGLSKSTISLMKNGKSSPTHETCGKLLLLGMTVEEIFGKEVSSAVRKQYALEGLYVGLSEKDCRDFVRAGFSSVARSRAKLAKKK